MNCKRFIAIASGLATLILCAVCGPSKAELADMTLHLDTVYEIDGVSRIPAAVFGVTAYEGAPYPAVPQWQQVMAESGIACLGFPAGIVAPPGEVSKWRKDPTTAAQQIESWYASPAAMRQITNGPIMGATYLYGQILPACRRMNIQPMMYLWGVIDESKKWTKQDHDLLGLAAANYVALLRRVNPDLRWVHLFNEPNATWFRYKKGGQDYADMFKVVAGAIKQKNPEVMVGGPTICWPPAWPPHATYAANWYEWDAYTMPLIRTAGDTLDFFDFHSYYGDLAVAVEQVQTVANALFLHRGRRVPVAITECGSALKPEEARDPTIHFRRRTLPWQRIIMAYLDRPATVLTMQMHDLNAAAGGEYRFLWGRNPANQRPTYYMYQVWRDFRGTRLVAHSSVEDVKVMAAGNGPIAVCMVFNDQDSPREVQVSLGDLPEGAVREGPAYWRCIYLDAESNRLVRAAGTGRRFVAEPRSTYAVGFEFARPWQPRKKAHRLEFFGQSVMNEFDEVGQTLSIDVDLPADAVAGSRSAAVRVGVLGSYSQDDLEMTVDGTSYPLANAENESFVGYQQVKLARVPPAGTTAMQFKLNRRDGKLRSERTDKSKPENRIRISSATLVIER